ncbi:MAG: hypothetical protein CMI08_00710 [Oceanospirillaceae bacterium]|nr:hypothetical protein [Oceanospirillaceae bacterium]MBL35039.1 hypothetical protein [Oceanospirillaceae bacterium]MBS53692.1 hypothetical protein [Oceanospirillaceae bacterium]
MNYYTLFLLLVITFFVFYAPHEGFFLPFLILAQSCMFIVTAPVYCWLSVRRKNAKEYKNQTSQQDAS